MEFITLSDLRLSIAEIQRMLAEEKELVLMARGQPIAVISGVDPERVEETLQALRQARAQLALSRMRRVAREKGLDTMPQEAIEAAIAGSL